MSSIFSRQMAFEFYAGNGVDNDLATFFMTGEPHSFLPWWEVDLGGIYAIGRIVIHDNGLGGNYLPLSIMASEDGSRYHAIHTISSRGEGQPWVISFDQADARFVRLQPSERFEVRCGPCSVEPGPSHGGALEDAEIQEGPYSAFAAGRGHQPEDLLSEPFGRCAADLRGEGANPALGAALDIETAELGEKASCPDESYRVFPEVLFQDGANSPGFQVSDAIHLIDDRTVGQLPHEGIDAEVAAPDVRREIEGAEGPQFDLELGGFDAPHSLVAAPEDVGAAVEPGSQPARGSSRLLQVAGQDEIEIEGGTPEQPVADITAGDQALRSTEPFPHPAEQEILCEGGRSDSEHRGKRIAY